MRIALLAILLGSTLGACRRAEFLRSQRDAGEPQIVALSVRSEPPGATVRVNRLAKVWKTPCDIADFSLGRGTHEVQVSLDGYETVTTRAAYDGFDPVTIVIKLPLKPETAPRAPVAVVEEPKPVPAPKAPEEKPVPPKAAPVEEPAAKPAPVKIEAVPGGTRVKVASAGAKIRLQAKTVVTEPEKPGEFFLPDVPPEPVVVEFLDPKTGAVLHSVEFAPVAVAPPPPAPVVEADRVGEIKVVSKTYGVFVKLDPGLVLEPGEEILVFRGGKEVARTKILKVTKADAVYPDGAAQVQKDGSIQKGDEVRRPKP